MLPEQDGYQPFKDLLSRNQKDVRDVFVALNQTDRPMDQYFIDELLGIPYIKNGVERIIPSQELVARVGNSEAFGYEGTLYHIIRHVLSRVNPQAGDVVYDLGAGYGRFCLYGTLTTQAHYKMVEVVHKRVRVAREAQKQYSIENLEVIEADVKEYDFSDGNIFYLFNPFSGTTLAVVKEKLEAIAQAKPITIVTYHMSSDFYATPWLQRVNDPSDPRSLRIYRSVQT